MAITYDPDTNTITVTGYTEGSPCTFEDVYNADKSGTLTLVDRDEITGTDTDPVNNTYNLRPADEKVMGGAKQDLWIEIENWSGFTDATIRLIGKDEAGNDQTEDITVTDNGTYYSSKLWTELTQTQVISVNGSGSFDYKLVQGQWGVVSKQGNNQYEFNCTLQIGDGKTETWLIDVNKMIYEYVSVFLYIKKYGHVRLGKVLNSEKKSTSGGCFVYAKKTNSFIIRMEQYSYLELYSTTLAAGGRVFFEPTINANIKIWNCNFEHIDFSGSPAQLDIYRLYYTQVHYGLRGIFTSAEDIRIADVDYVTTWYHRSESAVIKNIVTDKEEQYSFYLVNYTGNLYFIDTDWKWRGYFYSSSAKVYRQYTFNLKVVDEARNPIPGASVKIWDNAGNLVVNETTDSNGRIPEQILTYGYYDQDHWSTPVMITPHTIRIHHQDYPPKEFQFVADEPIDWTISLKDRPKSSGIIQVYGTEYYPGEEGIIYAQLLYGDGTPANNAVCNVTIWNKDNMLVSNQQMKHITNSNGMYYYNFTVPDDISVFLADVVCENPTAYGSAEFHVSNIDEIAKRVWNYTERTLTDYNESSIAQSVWNYTNRTLTGISITGIEIHTTGDFFYYPGNIVKIPFVITSRTDGEPVDYDSIKITIYNPSMEVIAEDLIPTKISTGIYYIDYNLSDLADYGIYPVIINATYQSCHTARIATFKVLPPAPVELSVETDKEQVFQGGSLSAKFTIKNERYKTEYATLEYTLYDSNKEEILYKGTTQLVLSPQQTTEITRTLYIPLEAPTGLGIVEGKLTLKDSTVFAYAYVTISARAKGIVRNKYILTFNNLTPEEQYIDIYKNNSLIFQGLVKEGYSIELERGNYKVKLYTEGKKPNEFILSLDRDMVIDSQLVEKYPTWYYLWLYKGTILAFVTVLAVGWYLFKSSKRIQH